jgi:hypothetical protein
MKICTIYAALDVLVANRVPHTVHIDPQTKTLTLITIGTGDFNGVGSEAPRGRLIGGWQSIVSSVGVAAAVMACFNILWNYMICVCCVTMLVNTFGTVSAARSLRHAHAAATPKTPTPEAA